MRCKTKQRKGSRSAQILGYRRITRRAAVMTAERSRASAQPGEINDHRPEEIREQNSAYRHRNEGRFRKRRRPSTLRLMNHGLRRRFRIGRRARSRSKVNPPPKHRQPMPSTFRPLYANGFSPRESRHSMEAENSRLAHPSRVAHALRCLEFDLAGDQDRPARFAAGFFRRAAFRRRGSGPARHFDRPHPPVAATPLRLFRTRLSPAC